MNGQIKRYIAVLAIAIGSASVALNVEITVAENSGSASGTKAVFELNIKNTAH